MTLGTFWERYRVRVSRLVGLVLVCIAHPRSRGLYALGFLVALGGETIRIWAAGHIRKGEELASTGPYAMTRHPLYLGSLLMASGFALACTSLSHWSSAALIWAAIAAMFHWPYAHKMRLEEDDLFNKFGAAFERYKDAVPALLPDRHLWPQARSTSAFSASRAIANKEHWTLLGLLGLAALLRLKMVYRL